jgi:predicted ArsR family transcriptional regulator
MSNPGKPDDLNRQIGVLTRREVEARILKPVIEALSAEFGQDRVHAILAETIKSIARQQGAELVETMGGNQSEQFHDSLKFWTKGDALEIEMLDQSKARLDFNVRRCRYAELYRDLGLAELGVVLSCNRDAALIEGFNPTVKFERSQTIMEGASFCDFRYTFSDSEG